MENVERLKQRGRRPWFKTDSTVKASITFFNDNIVFLDLLSAHIRAKSRAILDRGAIARAFICALEESNFDLTFVKSEEEARQVLTQQLSK